MGSGGATSTGGVAPTGGMASTGGDTASGGGASTGGNTASGGVASTGGVPSTGGFVHPGVLVNTAMLDFVKAKIAAGSGPWKAALSKAQSDSRGSLSYTAHPVADVQCGYYSNPDVGCTDELNDAEAAYTHALIWYHTGDARYGDKAVQIMNAWSAVLMRHSNDNAPVQAAWVSEVFPRAAEILASGFPGWTAGNQTAFKLMLKNAFLPNISAGSRNNGNWELSMIEAMMNIAVHTDDHALFNKAVSMWRARVPAYIYLATDGSKPVQPPSGALSPSALTSYWQGQTTYVDGLSQETCRDLAHTQMGLAAMLNAAMTAKIQGVNLFAEQEPRIVAALEFHANYLLGAKAPAWLCGGSLKTVQTYPTWDLAANVFGNVLQASVPKAQSLALGHRPSGVDKHMVFETLTHADLGAVGF